MKFWSTDVPNGGRKTRDMFTIEMSLWKGLVSYIFDWLICVVVVLDRKHDKTKWGIVKSCSGVYI